MKAMRNNKRQMTDIETLRLLQTGEYGVLSTTGEGSRPYGIPLSYVLAEKVLYFHCALVGHKLENIAINSQACFTVVGRTKILPEQFSTEYESVVVFGQAVLVEQEAEKREALQAFIEKYSPGFLDKGNVYIEKAMHKTGVIKFFIEEISGKHRV
jgi:nitroimidazol reductase NimA-like FMN-containing flavoprotein (pyridoxamine 5'-phosphate oxidase superfamily)